MLDQLNSVSSYYIHGVSLTLCRNIDIPGSLCDHNDNCYHADAPFSSRLFLPVTRVVRNSSLVIPPFFYQCCFSAHNNRQIGDLKFSKAERTHAISIALQRTEISVDVVFERHMAPQMSHCDSCAHADGLVQGNEQLRPQ
jgi:hypothetical protein